MNLKLKTHNGIYISAKIENKSKNPAKQHLKKSSLVINLTAMFKRYMRNPTKV